MRYNLKTMKILGIIVAVLVMTSCNSFAVQQGAEEKGKEETEQKLVKVCSLNSAEANQEFQKNVQVMQAQRQRVIQLQGQLEQTQTEDMKKSLKREIDAAMEKLNNDNKKMAETYGFSLNRNYVLVVEKAHVYMAVSDDENSKIKADKKKKKK